MFIISPRICIPELLKERDKKPKKSLYKAYMNSLHIPAPCYFSLFIISETFFDFVVLRIYRLPCYQLSIFIRPANLTFHIHSV